MALGDAGDGLRAHARHVEALQPGVCLGLVEWFATRRQASSRSGRTPLRPVYSETRRTNGVGPQRPRAGRPGREAKVLWLIYS